MANSRHSSLRTLALISALAVPIFAGCGEGAAQPTLTTSSTPTIGTIAAPSETPPARPHVVAISAGHGGPGNTGAVHTNASGQVDLVEKDVTLDVARRLDRLLRAAGYQTVMIRDCDCALSTTVPENFAESVRRESQARTDVANAAGAEALLLIHFNGSDDHTQSGTAVYYDAERTFGEQSGRLAMFIYNAIIVRLHDLGYETRPRGVLSDSLTAAATYTGTGHTFTLGEVPGFRASQMPGVIGEALFVSNDAEAAMLQRDDVRQAVAQAYKDGIDRYFAWLDGGRPPVATAPAS